jgi:hypothetical protein
MAGALIVKYVTEQGVSTGDMVVAGINQLCSCESL